MAGEGTGGLVDAAPEVLGRIPAIQRGAEWLTDAAEHTPVLSRYSRWIEGAKGPIEAAVKAGTSGALLGGLEGSFEGRPLQRAAEGAGAGAIFGGGLYSLGRIAHAVPDLDVTPQGPWRPQTVERPATIPSIRRVPGEIAPEHFPVSSGERIPAMADLSGNAELPGNTVLVRGPAGLLPAPVEKPATLNDLGRQIEDVTGASQLRNVPLREQVYHAEPQSVGAAAYKSPQAPPRVGVIPKVPLGNRVAMDVSEEFGPMSKRPGEIPRIITEEPGRQAGGGPLRPGVSLREQPKFSESPVRSEQARLEEKYPDKGVRQFTHSLGEEMVDAIGTDNPDKLRAAHDALTNPAKRQAAINGGLNMVREDGSPIMVNDRKASGDMRWKDVAHQLFEKGYTWQQIVEMSKPDFHGFR